MTRVHVSPLLAAACLVIAACPPPIGNTTESESDSDSDESSTTEDEETNGPTPSTPSTDPTTEAETNTTQGNSDSESQTGTTDDPTEPPTTDPPTGCQDNSECRDGAAPFCEDGECVSCSDTPDPGVACAGLSEDAPVCSDGVCVQCTADATELCNGSTPVCDGASNTCVGCTANAECPDSACNFETGSCADPAYVIYVDRLADCMVADGTSGAPFCKIVDAFTKISTDGVDLGWTVKIRNGSYLEESLTVPDGSVLTLIGWEGIPKLRAIEDTGPTLRIAAGSKVNIDSIAFNSNESDHGVLCEGSAVRFDDARLNSNRLQGYNSTECETTFRRTVVYDNDGGGIASYGVGGTWLWNSYVSGNGTQNFGDFGGIRTSQGNELHVIYSTVANNLANMGPTSLHCTEDAGATEVRNSVIIGFSSPSVDCPLGALTFSALDEGKMDGDTNVAAVKADLATLFDAQVAGVYKAKADTILKDLAEWKDGDPKADYDGDARPTNDGDKDYAGADRPAP